MTSHILQSLPEIHGILLGISIAFYSAFAIYVYQKIDASKEEIGRLVADARRFGTPDLIVTSNNKFLLQSALDWDNVADPFFMDIRGICKKMENNNFPDDKSCVEMVFKLCEIFYWMYVTHPFFGEYCNCDDVNRIEIENEKSRDITPERISTIEDRLMQIDWLRSHGYDQIIILAKRADKLEKKGVHLQGQPTDDVDESDIVMVTYEYLIKKYFGIAREFEFKILPSLKHAVLSRDYFLRRLDLKNFSRNSRAIFFYILTAGIILPLIIIEAGNLLTIHERAPYVMLLLTISPYFIAVNIIYQKIKSLKI